MADSIPSSSSHQSQNTSTATTTTITDLNVDSLVHSAAYLNLQDVCNLSMTCRYLKRVSYSDPIWQRFFGEHWRQQPSSSSIQLHSCGVREMYLARRTAVQQFKFADPFVANFFTDVKPFNHLQLGGNDIFLTQGSLIQMINMDRYRSGKDFVSTLRDHNARITCMRLFSFNDMSLFRDETEGEQKVLVTSSCDHSIRLWRKGSRQRCFRGHNGPVLSLSNKLLGEDHVKVLASGGDDGTVRLWSLSSSGKRGQHALKATLYGHEKSVNFIVVAGHRTTLLASISRDSKVRIWDTTTSSAVRSSCCVGMTSVPGAPVGMQCHESLLYIAAGSSVTAVDLRTMQKVMTVAVHQPKLHSFDIVPSKSLICTGGDGRAMLWDIRRNQEGPVAELDGHCGPVTLLHMDSYKIVTGGPQDTDINVWEVDTGAQTNSLSCCCGCGEKEAHGNRSGCGAIAVDGCRIATASYCEDMGILRFRDFSKASSPVMNLEDDQTSKFWDPSSDGISSDWQTSDYGPDKVQVKTPNQHIAVNQPTNPKLPDPGRTTHLEMGNA